MDRDSVVCGRAGLSFARLADEAVYSLAAVAWAMEPFADEGHSHQSEDMSDARQRLPDRMVIRWLFRRVGEPLRRAPDEYSNPGPTMVYPTPASG